MFSFEMIGILIAVGTYILNARKERKLKLSEMYNTLEFASIDLFRFEIEHHEKFWVLYDTSQKMPEKGTKEFWVLKEYVCQILNLFEMAVEFVRGKLFRPDIFVTWAVWIWEIGSYENFQVIWEDTKQNYSTSLVMTIDKAISISKMEISDRDKKKKFYEYIKEKFKCDVSDHIDM